MKYFQDITIGFKSYLFLFHNPAHYEGRLLSELCEDRRPESQDMRGAPIIRREVRKRFSTIWRVRNNRLN